MKKKFEVKINSKKKKSLTGLTEARRGKEEVEKVRG